MLIKPPGHQTREEKFLSRVKGWNYIKIELEILGKVVDARFVPGYQYDNILAKFKRQGKAQPYEWAIYIKKHITIKNEYERKVQRDSENERRRAKRGG